MASHDLIIQYLASTKIGEKGQLTVPKQYREDLGLATGAPFAVLRMGNGLILIPEQQRFEQLCSEINRLLGASGISERDALATLPEARRRVYQRRYCDLDGKHRGRKARRNSRGK